MTVTFANRCSDIIGLLSMKIPFLFKNNITTLINMKNNNLLYIVNKDNYTKEDISTLYDRAIKFDSIALSGCTLNFQGKNNILIITGNTKFNTSKIVFKGDNSIVIIGDSQLTNTFIGIHHNSNVFIGHKTAFNAGGATKRIIVGEGQSVIIGNECLFSVNLWIRNTSGHPIYDFNGNRLDQPGGGVFIGDHVWFGETASILGPATVASGSIIGANSFVHNKIIKSNSLWAGEPCKHIVDNRCWIKESTVTYSATDIDNSRHKEVDSVIFNNSPDSISSTQIDNLSLIHI